MGRIKEAITLFAQSLGLPGLALITFLDSSFLTFPELPDIWLMLLVTSNRSEWIWYTLVTTGSSIAGCYVLYELARRGGETFLQKRLGKKHIERGLAAFRKYGLLTIVVPSVLPPPMPFKPFVLLAGLAKVRPRSFLMALIIGRGSRYGLEALLAYHYGAVATDYVQRHAMTLSIALAAVIVVIGVAYLVWKRVRRDA